MREFRVPDSGPDLKVPHKPVQKAAVARNIFQKVLDIGPLLISVGHFLKAVYHLKRVPCERYVSFWFFSSICFSHHFVPRIWIAMTAIINVQYTQML